MAHDQLQKAASLARAKAELEEEHRGLRRLIGRLREEHDTTALVAAIENLHDKLRAHFQHEEFPAGSTRRWGRSTRATPTRSGTSSTSTTCCWRRCAA